MLEKLHIYAVYLDPKAPAPEETVTLIKEGFNGWAFVLTGLWALYHRLWWVAAGIFIYNGAINALLMGGMLSIPTVMAIQLGVQAMLGFHGNDLRQRSLKQQGYILVDIVTSDTELRAAQRYFDRQRAVAPATTS